LASQWRRTLTAVRSSARTSGSHHMSCFLAQHFYCRFWSRRRTGDHLGLESSIASPQFTTRPRQFCNLLGIRIYSTEGPSRQRRKRRKLVTKLVIHVTQMLKIRYHRMRSLGASRQVTPPRERNMGQRSPVGSDSQKRNDEEDRVHRKQI